PAAGSLKRRTAPMKRPYLTGLLLLGLGIAVAGPALMARGDPRAAASYSFVSIDYSAAPETVFDGINEFGDVAGWFNFTPDASPTGDTPVVFSEGQFRVIDIPGSMGGRALGINKKGILVGGYQDPGGGFHGFIAKGVQVTPLDFPGGTGTAATDIN